MNRLLLLLLLVPFRALQDVPALLQQAAQLESGFKEEEALVKYQEIIKLQPHNVFALCHCSDLNCRIGNRQDSRDKKIGYFKAGHDYADAAWRLMTTNSQIMSSWLFPSGA